MPRFVRPAWITTWADGRATDAGVGPRSRDGFASGRVTLRTGAGDVSESITFDAGGQDDRGAARFALTIPATFTVDVDHTADGRTLIVARPR